MTEWRTTEGAFSEAKRKANGDPGAKRKDVAPGIPEGSMGGGSAHNVIKMLFKLVPSVFNSAQNAFKVRSLRLSLLEMRLRCV